MCNVLARQSADAIESVRQQRRALYRIMCVTGNHVNYVLLEEQFGHPLRLRAPVSSEGTGGHLNDASVLCKLNYPLRHFEESQVTFGMGNDRLYAAAGKPKQTLLNRRHRTEI